MFLTAFRGPGAERGTRAFPLPKRKFLPSRRRGQNLELRQWKSPSEPFFAPRITRKAVRIRFFITLGVFSHFSAQGSTFLPWVCKILPALGWKISFLSLGSEKTLNVMKKLYIKRQNSNIPILWMSYEFYQQNSNFCGAEDWKCSGKIVFNGGPTH